MPVSLDVIRGEVERRAIVQALREHPEWALADLRRLLRRGGTRAAVLAKVTLCELVSEWPVIRVPFAGELSLAVYDEHVHELLVEAGEGVRVGYLIERGVDGPRWKRRAALQRLTDAGRVTRSGTTYNTRYLGVVE